MSTKRLLLQFLGMCLGLLLVYAGLVRFERRTLARLDLRGDPRWGPLWPLVDALRALSKRATGERATGAVQGWALAGPLAGLLLALSALALLPSGPDIHVGGFRLWASFTAFDADLLVVTLLGVAPALCVWLAGALSGQAGLREGATEVAGRALAYAAAGLLPLAGAALVTGERTLSGLVRWQSDALPLAVYQPLGLVLYALACALGSRRLPAADDAPSPSLLDYHLQHAGSGWALLHLVEYLGLLYSSAVIALIYLGGWGGAGAHLGLRLIGVLAVLWTLLWLRRTWYRLWRPRFGTRAWAWLLVLGAANLLVTAIALLAGGAV